MRTPFNASTAYPTAVAIAADDDSPAPIGRVDAMQRSAPPSAKPDRLAALRITPSMWSAQFPRLVTGGADISSDKDSSRSSEYALTVESTRAAPATVTRRSIAKGITNPSL